MTSAANGNSHKFLMGRRSGTHISRHHRICFISVLAKHIPHNPEPHLQGFNQVKENKNMLI